MINVITVSQLCTCDLAAQKDVSGVCSWHLKLSNKVLNFACKQQKHVQDTLAIHSVCCDLLESHLLQIVHAVALETS